MIVWEDNPRSVDRFNESDMKFHRKVNRSLKHRHSRFVEWLLFVLFTLAGSAMLWWLAEHHPALH